MSRSIPYCGAPPDPLTLAHRWNLDPILLAALATIALAYGLYSVRRPGGRPLFFSGWTVAAVALASPLCALSVSLFSARIAQHMILTLLAAPLVAAGLQFGPRPRPPPSLLAAAVFAALLWFWHAPGPYAWTFLRTDVYWAMHLSLFASALWLWSTLLSQSTPAFAAIGAGMLTALQMGLLGAVLTFAPAPLFAPHLITTLAWGLTPLEDQQLGGVLMWVPGCLALLAAACVRFWQVLEPVPPTVHAVAR
jgi:putative membrane protein